MQFPTNHPELPPYRGAGDRVPKRSLELNRLGLYALGKVSQGQQVLGDWTP